MARKLERSHQRIPPPIGGSRTGGVAFSADELATRLSKKVIYVKGGRAGLLTLVNQGDSLLNEPAGLTSLAKTISATARER